MSLKSMLNELRIPSEDQTKLFQAGINNYESLKARQYQLDRRTLSGVDQAAQRIVSAALVYLDSLGDDPLPKFSKKGWMTFAVTLGEPTCLHPSSSVGGEGGNHSSALCEANVKKITLESEMLDKCLVSEETKNSDADAMEVDEDDEDDEKARRAKDLGHIRPSRDHIDREVVDEAEIQSDDEGLEPSNRGRFAMMSQGFKPGESGLFDIPVDSDSSDKDEEHLPYLDFNGRRYWNGKCYHFKDAEAKEEKGSKPIVVGIKRILKNPKTKRVRLVCVAVIHINDTFLGYGDNGEFEEAVSKNYPSLFVQVKGEQSLQPSDLGLSSSDPSEMPKLIYEPQTSRCRQQLAYVRDNDGNNVVRMKRDQIRLIEGFAGAGGMHLGYEEEGFTTVQAIEYNDMAVKTFKHNNPDVPVFHGDIRKFLKQMEEKEYRDGLGRIDVIHTSSPCQGFSKANRNGGQNDDENNSLSFTFPTLLRLTGALVGTFENVEGMWTKKGMPYLRKILIECIALGYQVRVKILRCCDYGDPQKRPRLIIIAAKNFVPMPSHPVRTHGPGKLPYVTTQNVLEPLRNDNVVEMGIIPNMEPASGRSFNEKEDTKLKPHTFSPAVLAAGNGIFHYDEDRQINVRERAALQSFPCSYEFLGNETQQKKQIGNAVPIELSRAIARSVRDSLRYGYIEEIETMVESMQDLQLVVEEEEDDNINNVAEEETMQSEHVEDDEAKEVVEQDTQAKSTEVEGAVPEVVLEGQEVEAQDEKYDTEEEVVIAV